MTRPTIADVVQRQLKECSALATEFFTQHSQINPPAAIEHRPAEGAYAISIAFPQWQLLSEEGGRLQTKLLSSYDRLWHLIRSLVAAQPVLLDQVQAADQTIRHIVQQGMFIVGVFFPQTSAEVLTISEQAFRRLEDAVRRLDDPSPSAMYIPDTNALLHNVGLDRWRFPDSPTFTVLLLPTVLSELDSLKVNHRNDDVRKKAELLISLIKDFRRRGSLQDGVTLSRGVSQIRSIAVEPDFNKAPAWLSKDSNDDRILACVFELLRQHPRSPIVLVTRDINMQNKAQFAGIEFCEPPDPPPSP